VYFSYLKSIHVTKIINKIKCKSKLCDFLQQSIQKNVCDNKIYSKIFLPTYILFIVSELGYLLHVHTYINNFESLLFFILMIFLFQVFNVSM
jgi:hypothetical protein